MNPSDPLARRIRQAAPVLRSGARHRSLENALAALTDSAPAPASAPPRPVRRRISRHWIGWAACWLITAVLWAGNPSHPDPAPSEPGPTAGHSGWQSRSAPHPDDDTARLLATLYPSRDNRYFSPRLF